MNLKKIGITLSIIVSIFVIGTYFLKIESRWAKAEDLQTIQQSLQKLEKRLDYKILSDKMEYLWNRIYVLIDRYGDVSKMPDSVREEYRKRKLELEEVQKKLDTFE
jgi:hypothetical protein